MQKRYYDVEKKIQNGNFSEVWGFDLFLVMVSSSMIFVYSKFLFSEMMKWDDLSFFFDRNSF